MVMSLEPYIELSSYVILMVIVVVVSCQLAWIIMGIPAGWRKMEHV